MAKLRILDEAAREVDAAAAYLEEQRAGYGRRFVDAYEQKLAQIARHDLRSFWIRKFGYSIIVGHIGGQLTIIAVMHHSREPGYWLDRLQ